MTDVYEVELCRIGSSTATPCPNPATTEDEYGVKVCGAHRRIIALGREIDGYCLAAELLEEAIAKLEEHEIFGASGLPLLKRAYNEAVAEHERLEQEMDALDPLKA
jgi:hypothetical protein